MGVSNFLSNGRRRQYPRLGSVFGAALCAILLHNPSHAQEHFGASFGVWHTLCDADLNCAAYTYAGTPENPKSGHVFNLDRRAATVAWTMSLWLDGIQPNVAYGVMASVIRYGHDSEPIQTIETADLAVKQDQTEPGQPEAYTLFLTGPNAETVMERLRPGDILDFEFGGCKDEFLSATFLLDGVTAALAWIDQQQKQPGGSATLTPLALDSTSHNAPSCVD